MPNLETLQAELKQLGDGIKTYQDKLKVVEEKQDGLVSTELKNLEKKTLEQLEKVNKIEAELKSEKERNDLLEKQLARGINSGTDNSEKLYQDYKNGFVGFLRKGTAINEKTIKDVYNDIIQKTLFGEADLETGMKLLQVQVNPDGGYLVRPERLAKKIERTYETSPMRELATVVNTTSDSVELDIDDDEAAHGGWVGETESRGKTGTPKIGSLTIPVHEHFAQPLATQKMLDDAGFDVEAWLARKVDAKFTRVENTSFVNGDGNKKARGFLDYPAWASAGVYQREALEHVKTGVNGSITADSLIKIQNALLEIYQNAATWLMKRTFWNEILTLKDSNNNYLINPQLLYQGVNKVLLGNSVKFADDMPSKATDSLSIAYGDFKSAYTIVDRIGIRVIRDNLTEKPFTKFYTTKRVGGTVTNYEALKLLKLAA